MANTMRTAANVRRQIEAALQNKIPSALTPHPKTCSAVQKIGIEALDHLLQGGLPQGAVSELVGPECSGRTSIALSFVSRMTQEGKVCAWVDVSDSFDPLSAAATGVDLKRLLWLRCGVHPVPPQTRSYNFELPEKYLIPAPKKKGVHGGGCGPHPRHEIRGLSDALGTWLHANPKTPLCTEPQVRKSTKAIEQFSSPAVPVSQPSSNRSLLRSTPWQRMDQALRSADLLLQAGGFSAIVLDMAALKPEFVSRVPLATWYRYRAAAARMQSSVLLLTQHPCAKSSAELLLRLQPAVPIDDESTVFAGIQPHVEIARRRYAPETSNVLHMRKPPQRTNAATWQSRTSWTGTR